MYSKAPDIAIINRTGAMHREKEEGSFEPGKLADLIILSQNVFEIDPRDIAKTEVLLTMVGGKIVHDAR